jgi:thiol:disulfide interchange protein
MPESVQTRLGDGYSVSPRASAQPQPQPQSPAEAEDAADKGDETSAAAEEKKTEAEATATVQKAKKAKPTTATTTSKGISKDQEKQPPAKTQVSIPGAVAGYLKRMGPWIIISSGLKFATQASGLALYAWTSTGRTTHSSSASG